MYVPLSATEARKRARAILEDGDVTFTKHCMDELAKDRKSTIDAINVIRGGAYSAAEWENGSWRYRVQTQRMAVVIEFDYDTALLVVTAFVFRK